MKFQDRNANLKVSLACPAVLFVQPQPVGPTASPQAKASDTPPGVPLQGSSSVLQAFLYVPLKLKTDGVHSWPSKLKIQHCDCSDTRFDLWPWGIMGVAKGKKKQKTKNSENHAENSEACCNLITSKLRCHLRPFIPPPSAASFLSSPL